MTKQSATRRFTVSHRQDPAEVQAEQAAEVVARGGSVSGWSFGSVPVSAAVHRDEKDEKEPRKATLGDLGEALSKTPPGKKLQEVVMDRPEVKAALRLTDERAFQIIAGAATLGGMGVAYGAKSDIMSKVPAIPIGTTGGYDITLAPSVKSPAGDPNTFGLTLTLSPSSAKSKPGSNERPDLRNDPVIRSIERARLAAENKSAVDDLKKEEEPVQREPLSLSESDSSSDLRDGSTDLLDSSADLRDSSIEGVVAGGGRPLDGSTRHSMEARFGHDFRDVRLHDDAGAAAAAAGVSARAFTVGQHIVFGAGGYDSTTPAGQHLLAHELAHVIQQRGKQGESHLHRRSAGESFAIWLGLEEGSWTDTELTAYLADVTGAGRIEGRYDSDNKARAIVGKWKVADPKFALTGPQKVLLIAEMLDGPTGDDDEIAILELLENSDASDLRAIMASPEVGVKRLNRNLDGEEHERLIRFLSARFKGGKDSLEAGKVEVLGDAVPATAPTLPFSPDSLVFWLRSDRPVSDILAILDRMAAVEREKVLRHLTHNILPAVEVVLSRAAIEKAKASNTEAQRKAIDVSIEPDLLRRERAEMILEHYALMNLPTSKERLVAETTAVDPAVREEVRAALRPQLHEAANAKDKTKKKDAASDPAIADPVRYKAEIKARLIIIINEKFDKMVTKAGTKADMPEILRIAAVAKKETDAVFEHYYLKKPAEFVGDTKTKRGNLHSWFAEAGREITDSGPKKSPGRRQLADGWAQYYLQAGSDFRAISEAHQASPKFTGKGKAANPAGQIYLDIAAEVAADEVLQQRLLDTYQHWGGMNNGEVNVDLYHDPDPVTDRKRIWSLLRTLIHEYMHGLVAKAYEDYATTFGPSSTEWNTLIEGVDEVLTGMVWAHLIPHASDPDLRKQVEGTTYAALPPMELPRIRGYASYTQAMQLIALVGVNNVIAAYFQGEVDRIRVSDAAAKKADKAAAKGGKK